MWSDFFFKRTEKAACPRMLLHHWAFLRFFQCVPADRIIHHFHIKLCSSWNRSGEQEEENNITCYAGEKRALISASDATPESTGTFPFSFSIYLIPRCPRRGLLRHICFSWFIFPLQSVKLWPSNPIRCIIYLLLMECESLKASTFRAACA